MKKIASVLLILLVNCCGAYTDPFRGFKEAPHIGFGEYNGKVVASISYCDDCAHSGDYLIVKFTDGKSLTIYAYKYDMKVKK